ncbi:MAG TPA: hypothetical protein VM779_16185, partial [Thermoanaerobaculia bacterium]|nr:hypothetical protein [Thermoanaerobaculia bacterium]
KKYVHPDQVRMLVVGKQADFDKPLSTFGTVTPVDITIPQPGASAAPAEGNAAGQALAFKVREFVGGKARLDAVTSVRYSTSMSRQTPQGPMAIDSEILFVFPGRVRSVMKMPMGEMTMVLTPDAAFMSMGGMGTRDIPASQRDAMEAESKLDVLTVMKYPERYTFAVTGTDQVGDVQAQVLEVSSEGDSVKWLVDPTTGKVLRKVAKGEQVTEYGEWKSFEGIMFPTESRIIVNGEQVGTSQAKAIEVNPAVDAAAFERPAA